MEPREVLALYEGYEWRRRREAGMLALLFGQLMNIKPDQQINVDRLIAAAEAWLPTKERK